VVCKFCGKEIPDHSGFCLHYGKATHVVARPAALLSQPSSFRPLMVLFLAVLGFVICYAISANRETGASRTGNARSESYSICRRERAGQQSGRLRFGLAEGRIGLRLRGTARCCKPLFRSNC